MIEPPDEIILYNRDNPPSNGQDACNYFYRVMGIRMDVDEICICGHPIQLHIWGETGRWNCLVGRTVSHCPCQAPYALFRTEDIYTFGARTKGFEEEHALQRGLERAIRNKVPFQALDDIRCFHCGDIGAKAVGVSLAGEISPWAEARNVLLCRNCLDYFGREELLRLPKRQRVGTAFSNTTRRLSAEYSMRLGMYL